MLDRRITYLPLLNSANRPAINQGDIFTNQNLFTTNGAGRRQTWFEVDGGTDTDSWGRQTIFTSIPLPAVQEMTVLVNSFSAELRRQYRQRRQHRYPHRRQSFCAANSSKSGGLRRRKPRSPASPPPTPPAATI